VTYDLDAIAALPASWYAARPIPDRLIRDMERTHDWLSEAELSSLRAAACGLTHVEEAAARWVGRETTKSHRARLRLKLGARTMPHAVALGFVHGYLTADAIEG